ncbi:GatB/YqeY domain-containing protein [Gemmata obscuriglobus]|uniref:GatB/YqeY domain-containing protein n=1 Tax=Gemmata obscuriglobus TaxID=114 RepID=UPI00016C41E7|nr:GatB/YqeY domain-containing protein [Gemmata obscuriglobus]
MPEEQETDVSLHDELKARVTAAVKSGDALTRDALRTVLGEAQAEAVRRKVEATDEVVLGVVRKTVTGLKETIPLAKNAGRDTTQREAELALLESLLPKAWGQEAIAAALVSIRDDLRAAKNEGQALGVAMKALKAQGATANPDDVKAVVAAVRA